MSINYSHHNPEATRALYALEKALASSPLDRTLIDLVKLRVSQINGCAFCTDMHVKEAKMHGVRELKLYHLPIWHESPLFSDKERVALAWAEQLTRKDPEHATTFNQVVETFSEKEVADLTLVIAAINAWNVLGVAFKPVPGSQDKFFGIDKAGLA